MNKPEKIIKILLKDFNTYREPTIRRTSRYKDPFETLITCLLSLRTQDKNTEKATETLFKRARTPEEILKLPTKTLEKFIFSSGYYKNKARTIKHVTKMILKEHNGKVPKTREQLMAIKGIGPKTANIVLCFAYNQNVIPVDTHVHRIPNRIGLIQTKTPEQTEVELMKIFPKKYWRDLNTTLILFGQNICLPISPKCSQCKINHLCDKINIEKSR